MTEYINSTFPSSGTTTTNGQVLMGVYGTANYGDTTYFVRSIVSQNPSPDESNAIIDVANYVATGDNGGQWVSFGHQFTTATLAPGTYYHRHWITFVSGTNISGSPTAVHTLTIQDIAPVATQTNPANGASISWPDNANYPLQLQWSYSGGSGQSAYQVVVERNSDGLVIVDSGKVVNGSARSHTASIPQTYRDTTLRWKVRVWNAYDTVSAYTGYRTVFMATPPTIATQVSPLDNAIFSWTGSDPYPLPIQWTYSGSGPQSAYRIVVERASDAFVVADTGSVSSAASSATVNIPLAYRDVTLRWRMTVANQFGTVSPFTVYRTVKLLSPPSASITSPTEAQVLSVGTPAVSGAITVSPSLSVNKIVASLWDGLTKVWEKTVTGTWNNGASYSITDDAFFMTPDITYTYRVEATDTQGVVSPTTTRNFSVQYTAPNTPGSVTVVTTNYADDAYVSVSWPDTGRDADFYAWEVEREDSLLDQNTQAVLSVGPWAKIGAVYVPDAGGYEFRDYLAPAGYSVRYRVRQVSLKFNTQVFGNYSTSTSSTINTSVYWLIAGTNGSTSTISTYKIWLVNSDTFTDETEESEFNLIGRGRYVEKGTPLGKKGQLGVQLRDSADGTARQKRLELEDFISATSKATLRDPFGNAYYVSVGNISETRVPGVGKSEFTDITIPYSEVAV